MRRLLRLGGMGSLLYDVTCHPHCLAGRYKKEPMVAGAENMTYKATQRSPFHGQLTSHGYYDSVTSQERPLWYPADYRGSLPKWRVL